MLHKVILLHGVNNSAGVAHWTDKLEAMWEAQGANFKVTSWAYGGLFMNRTSAALTWLPGYRHRVRVRALNALAEIEATAAKFSKLHGRLSIVGHSFAGHITQAALEHGWHFHRIILLASAMDENFNWRIYDRQFDQVEVYWSPCDEVIPWSPYGQQGVRGPQVDHPRVASHKVLNMKHNDWTTDAALIQRADGWRAFLEE